jgi:hypothetical protein
MKTLAAVVSKDREMKTFSTRSEKEPLKGMAHGDWARHFSGNNSEVPVPEQFRSYRSAGSQSVKNSSEEPVTETATVKNQKTSHWFMCYKSVQ